jgi:hypothetical protein
MSHVRLLVGARKCNAPRSSRPIFSRCFPAGFSDSRRLSTPYRRRGQPCGWDRILACVGTESIPVSGGQNLKEEHPAKAAGRSSRFVAQGLRSGASPKKMGLLVYCSSGRARFDSRERSKKLLGERDPPAQRRHAGGL